ncbi:hypothetical protein SDC9_180100 [bioreactor metagenome]|uniref:Uncharacterized protein n=1 Tax=bioreactor metagenome TaxID=1076179 RepID=A0A645H1S3_9ZZZZ
MCRTHRHRQQIDPGLLDKGFHVGGLSHQISVSGMVIARSIGQMTQLTFHAQRNAGCELDHCTGLANVLLQRKGGGVDH